MLIWLVKGRSIRSINGGRAPITNTPLVLAPKPRPPTSLPLLSLPHSAWRPPARRSGPPLRLPLPPHHLDPASQGQAERPHRVLQGQVVEGQGRPPPGPPAAQGEGRGHRRPIGVERRRGGPIACDGSEGGGGPEVVRDWWPGEVDRVQRVGCRGDGSGRRAPVPRDIVEDGRRRYVAPLLS